MHKIQLKTVDLDNHGTLTKLSYQAQLVEILRTPSDGRSADYEEVRRSIRLLDALENVKDDLLELEDADHAYLKERVLGARWPLIDKVVQQFIVDVTEGG